MQASPPQTPGVLVIPGEPLLKLLVKILMADAFSTKLKARSCVYNSANVIVSLRDRFLGKIYSIIAGYGSSGEIEFFLGS